ncbi:MAG: glycosyltransferase family 9 protein, partial [Chlorobi bacterium]|nr:glycosyltransferase family 9 protein [Chlorobiota bacterium]
MDNSTNQNNYLIIQTAFLGDVVLSLSMAEYIKSQDSKSKVVFLTTKAGSPIAEECEFIDKVISYDKRGKDRGIRGIIKISKRLNEFDFTAVFTPHRSFRSSILTKLIKSRSKYGFDKNSISWLFSDLVKYCADKHEIVRNLSLVRAYWKDNSDEIIKPKLNKNGLKNDYVIMAPGSVWNTKRLPKEKWVELILHPYMLDRKVILIGAKGDIQTAEAILKRVDGKHPSLVNRTGQDDIKQTIEVIAQGRLLISNDSAP